VLEYLGRENWRAIINCAAYTAVDRAESDAENAARVNTAGPALLARESAARSIPIVHVSTDYVFDGQKASPYLEDDSLSPLGVYARTKADGEIAVRTGNPRHAIIRTAWVQSVGAGNFINTMITKGAEMPEMRVVADQFGCPSSAHDIGDALLTVALKLGRKSGTWHFVNSGEASWYDLARHVFDFMSARGMKVPLLTPITTADYPTAAPRPVDSRLSTDRIQQDFGIVPRPWQAAMNDILNERFGKATYGV
jgi:dTDP-4-dehydrorhamnose reductase